MKKFTLALTACCLAALLLTGCLSLGQQDGGAASEREAAALDPLTGELARWPGQRPASVFLYNGMDADRQWGIGEASAQAGFDNVLILYSAPSRRDDGYSWGYDLTMGAGIYLNGGSVWSILWMPGADSTLAIYNSDGTALDIRPGTSYIALMGSVAGQEVVLRDSAGAEISAN